MDLSWFVYPGTHLRHTWNFELAYNSELLQTEMEDTRACNFMDDMVMQVCVKHCFKDCQ